MRRFLDTSALQGMAILLGLGLAVGIVGNLAAGPTRQLEWGRAYPPKGKPNCPETLPGPGASAAASPMAAPPMAALAQPATASAAVAGESPFALEVPETTGAAPADPVNPPDADPAVAGSRADQAPPAGAPPPLGATAPAAAAPSSTPPAPAAQADVPAVPPDKPWLELAPAHVDALFDRGATFIDARMTSQYEEGHIRGAIAIPVWESGVDAKVAQVAFEVEGDMMRPIVIYCNGGDCEDSHMLGQQLWESGHQAVYVYKDGYPDWIGRGRPASTGAAR